MVWFALWGAKRLQSTPNAQLGEFESVLWALREAEKLELTHIVVESDCLSIIKILTEKTVVKGELGAILEGINNVLGSFSDCRWSAVKREANKAAHLMASLRPLNVFTCFSFQFPDCLNSIVATELAE